MTFAEKIQKLRKERSLSQDQLAATLDVSRQSISKWELGDDMPKVDKILLLSGFFGVSTDYLLHDDWQDETGCFHIDVKQPEGPADPDLTSADSLNSDVSAVAINPIEDAVAGLQIHDSGDTVKKERMRIGLLALGLYFLALAFYCMDCGEGIHAFFLLLLLHVRLLLRIGIWVVLPVGVFLYLLSRINRP